MLTPSEMGLAGLVIALISGGSGVFWAGRYKVSRNECALKHDGLDKLLDAKLDPIQKDISEIKKEIKRQNGKG